MINKHKLHTEMIANQRKTHDIKYNLETNDLLRVCKNIDLSIFYSDECVLWKKFLTKTNNDKSCYVNFHLRKKKFALHRILYINFIGDLKPNQYLKYACDNPGQCCNLQHFYKVNEDDEKDICSVIDNSVNIHKIDSSDEAHSKLNLIFDD